MNRPGLRTRVTATFAAGALAISTAVAILSYDLTRSTLLASRQRSAVRTAYIDATVAQAGLTGDDPDVIAVLRSLDTGGTRHAVIYRQGQWYARVADAGITSAIPATLKAMVATGQPGAQRVQSSSGAALAIGIRLDDGSQFYVVDSLAELGQTLKTLALILTLVAAGTTAAGAAVGAYSSRLVLRPLTEVSNAARDISAGNLDARLDPATEPDLKRLTTTFNDMVDQLAERIERDRHFAADVSHELRSPLQTLAAAASVLHHRRDTLDERSAVAASLVSEEVSRFQSLVTDLLELARGDQPADRTNVDVAAVAQQVCRSRQISTHLIITAPGTPTMWQVDRRRFEQILANLLDNAARHGGGVVAVRISADHRYGRIDVDDDGPGVAPAERNAIFHRFVRGPGANARADSNGTGLGLALVAEHVAAHGGEISVLDRPDGGARFRVQLPLVGP